MCSAGGWRKLTGRDAVALTLFKQAWQLAGDGGVNLRVLVIRSQAAAGELEAARAAKAELERAAAAGTIRLHPRDRALMALGFEQRQEALDAFDLAFAERDPALVWLRVDPRVDGLRSESRFKAMLEKLGLN